MSHLTITRRNVLGAGELTVLSRPTRLPEQPRPGIMFVHGAGSDATFNLDPEAKQGALTALTAEAGVTGLSGDNGGPQTWGNDTALTALTVGANYLTSRPGVAPGPVALVGSSMGGLNAFAWAAQNRSRVSCVVAIIPVVDVTDIHANNRQGCAPLINAAYPGGWSQAAYGPAHNPITLAQAGKLAGLPILLFYGLTDNLCLPGRAEAFAAAVGPTVELVAMPYGHDFDSYRAVDHDRVMEFLTENAGW